jgi:pyruvate formate-lyase activating enzyme-like uncharacterized protein
MQERKTAALEQIKSLLWQGDTSKAIQAAIETGITQPEIEKLEKSIESLRQTIETGNAANIPELAKSVTSAEKIETKARLAMEEAEASYQQANWEASTARNALQSAKNAVYLLAANFASGHIPAGIEMSESVMACLKQQEAQAATDARRVELRAKVTKLSNEIETTQGKLDGMKVSLARGTTYARDKEALEKQLATLATEKAATLAELVALA